MAEVERAVERYSQGVGHLGRQLPLPGPPQMLLVTHRRATAAATLGGDSAAAEAVVHAQPSWSTSIPAPASWDTLPSDTPEVPPLIPSERLSFPSLLRHDRAFKR